MSDKPGFSISEKEYSMIREEIMYNQNQRDTFERFAYTVVTAIYAVAFAAHSCWLMLCTILLLLPISFRIFSCNESIHYLSSYLASFGKSVDIAWEHYHHKYQEKFKPESKWYKKLFSQLRLDFFLLISASSLLFWLLRGFSIEIHGKLLYGIIILIFQIAAAVIELIVPIRNSIIGTEKKNEMINNWKALMQEQPEQAE